MSKSTSPTTGSRTTPKTTRSPKVPAPAAPRDRSTVLLIGLILAMIAVAVAIVVIYQANNDTSSTTPTLQQTQPVSVTGTLVPFTGDGADAAIGQAAPEATGRTFEGSPQALLSAGRPTMVVFAAHWCPHCQRELPLIVDWMDKGGNRDVDVVVVSTGTDIKAPNYPPSAWLDDVNFGGRVIADDDQQTLANAYGLKGYPLLVFVGADGKVSGRLAGEQPVDALDAGIAKISTGTGTGS